MIVITKVGCALLMPGRFTVINILLSRRGGGIVIAESSYLFLFPYKGKCRCVSSLSPTNHPSLFFIGDQFALIVVANTTKGPPKTTTGFKDKVTNLSHCSYGASDIQAAVDGLGTVIVTKITEEFLECIFKKNPVGEPVSCKFRRVLLATNDRSVKELYSVRSPIIFFILTFYVIIDSEADLFLICAHNKALEMWD